MHIRSVREKLFFILNFEEIYWRDKFPLISTSWCCYKINRVVETKIFSKICQKGHMYGDLVIVGNSSFNNNFVFGLASPDRVCQEHPHHLLNSISRSSFSVPSLLLSPSHSTVDNPPCDLHFCGSIPVLVFGLLCFVFVLGVVNNWVCCHFYCSYFLSSFS